MKRESSFEILNAPLEDDSTPTGGTSFSEETVGDFIEVTDLPEFMPLRDMNKILKDCGIKPIEKKYKCKNCVAFFENRCVAQGTDVKSDDDVCCNYCNKMKDNNLPPDDNTGDKTITCVICGKKTMICRRDKHNGHLRGKCQNCGAIAME